MKEKIHYSVVFRAVEHAVEIEQDMLFCSECKKGFYKISLVDSDQPDFILTDKYVNDYNKPYCCNDHILYDLLIDPEVSEPILISITNKPKLGRKIQVHVNKVDARLFLPERMN